MSDSKELVENRHRSKTHKKYLEKHKKSILAPSSVNFASLPHPDPPTVASEKIYNKALPQQEKEELLNIIQSNEKEIDFLSKVVSQFLDLNELIKIKQNAEYDESVKIWILPQFTVQQRKTVFPKLQKSQLKELHQCRQKKYMPQQSPLPDYNYFLEEDCKKVVLNQDYDSRPATSFAKQRQRSNNQRIPEYSFELRKSPGIQKKTFDKKLFVAEEKFYL